MTADAEGELRLEKPMLVRWELVSQERLGTRTPVYLRLAEGVNAEELGAGREPAPRRLPESGCGSSGAVAEKAA